MTCVGRYSPSARDDLDRSYDHLLDRATTVADLDLPEQALAAITGAVESLRHSPFIYRKAGDEPFLHEMLISFGRGGYVALFAVEDPSKVTILAVRHQLGDDYH